MSSYIVSITFEKKYIVSNITLVKTKNTMA